MTHAPIGLGATTEWLNILEIGNKAIAAAGTAERVVTAKAAGLLIIQNSNGNSTNVIIGNADALYGVAATRKGIVLEPGQTITLPVRQTDSVYADVETSGNRLLYMLLG